MSLRTGSRIGPYRLLRDFVGGANCRWTLAERDGEEFFVKEFQRPKYPPDQLPAALRAARLARCRGFEDRHARLLAALRDAALACPGIVVPVAFFRDGLAYYHVAPRIPSAAPPPGEIARWPARERLAAMRSLTRAVASLHAARIAHGDLKPSNVLIVRESEGMPAARLIDFDGAFFAGEPADPDDVEFDQAYMAPEVLQYVRRAPGAAAGALGPASDRFSLGLLLHEYWTGRPPVPAGSYHYAAEAVLAGDGLRLETAGLDLSIETLLTRALSYDPAARPSTWDIDAALAHLTGGAVADEPDVFSQPDPRPKQGMAATGYAGPLPSFPSSFVVAIRKSRNLEREPPPET